MSSSNFKAYRDLFLDANAPTPRGIDSEDTYIEAFRDPVTISVTTEDARFPLIIPSTHIQWINQEFEQYLHPVGYWVGPEKIQPSEIQAINWDGLKKYGSTLLAISSKAEPASSHFDASAILRQVTDRIINLTQLSTGECSRVTNFCTHLTSSGVHQDPLSAIEVGIGEIGYSGKLVSYLGGVPRDIFEKLWALYEPIFLDLTAEHPLIGIQPNEELHSMMCSPDTITITSFEEEEIAGFIAATPIHNIPWLNQTYYQQKFPELYPEKIYYCPVIVGRQMTGERTALKLVKRLGDYLGSFDRSSLIFECPNRTEKYIHFLGKYLDRSEAIETSSVEIDEVTSFQIAVT